MPLGAMCTTTMLVGTKTLTRQATGEFKPSFSFTGAAQIGVRIYDTSLKSAMKPFGNTLEIDLRVKCPNSTPISPFLYDAKGSGRQQVKIYNVRPGENLANYTGIVYEVLWCRSPGNMGRYKELYLKRWK